MTRESEAPRDRLREAAEGVTAVQANTAEVIAALDATFDELPGPLDVPDDPRARLAVAMEAVKARVELIAAKGALAALEDRRRELLEPLGAEPDMDKLFAYGPELDALQAEQRQQRDRISVLEAVARDLDNALARSRTPG